VLLDVSQAERDKAHAAGNSLPDKSYPINDAKQLHAAAILAASGHGDVTAAKKLIRRRAKELGVDVTTLPGFGPSSDGKALDSRRPMDADTLIKALDLPEGADDQTILAAVSKLKAPEADGDVKTLEQQAADEGKIVLDAATVSQLQLDAAAGAAAQKQLHQERFDTAFKAAVDARKTTPAERDTIHHFYELDADATLKMLDAREAIMPTAPIGQPVLELDLENPSQPEQALAAGRHPGAHENHRRILQKLKELDLGPDAYTKVMLDMGQKGQLL